MQSDRNIQNEAPLEVQAQIPIFVRAFFYSAFRLSPLKEVGKSFYQYAARRIAHQLVDKARGTSVYLFGGTVDRCIPALSDLDFLILKQKKLSHDELWELRGSYFELKRRFPFLGEIHLSQKSYWKLLEESGAAVQLWFANKQKFKDGRFQKTGKAKTSSYCKFSQLALCIHHYQRAQKYLIHSFQMKSVSRMYLAHFTREVSKALSFAQGDTVKIEHSVNPAFLMAKAFFQIHTLARMLPLEVSGEFQGVSLGNEKSQAEQFLTTVINREHLASLHRFSDELSLLKNSSIPLALSVHDNLSFSSALRIMNSYVSYLEKMTEGNVDEKFPLILSQSMIHFTSYGWNWGESLSHLGWATPGNLEDPKWIRNLKGHTEARLRERLLLNLNLVMGKLVCGQPEKILSELKTLSREVLWLGTGYLESRDSLLMKAGKAKFPFAYKILQLRLDKGPLPGMGELFELCLGLCAEAEALLIKLK